VVSSNRVISEGKAKLAKSDYVAARKVLNDALTSGQLSAEDNKAAKQLIAEANKWLIFSPKKFSDDPLAGAYTVQIGDRLSRVAANKSTTWEFLGSINNLSDPKKLRAGQTLKVIEGPFNAVVTKSTFTMDIWLGDPEKKGGVFITSFPVGLGRDDSTPTGVWMVEAQRKLKNPTYFSPRGEGIIEADDPKNPLGEYWIGLTGTDGAALGKMSYGIHGTIEPESIGHQSSLGCIRMRNDDIAMVFNMLVEGKSIVIVRN